MSDLIIQSLSIPSHSIRTSPDEHVAYAIQVTTPTRNWTVWRRYSEFDDLYTSLQSAFHARPPSELPPKHSSIFNPVSWGKHGWKDENLIRERKAALEKFLRDLLVSKDGKWRETPAFKEFLNVPLGKAPVLTSHNEEVAFTSQSWLDEQQSLVSLVRQTRALLSRRDSLLASASAGSTSTISDAHSTSVEAKKQLAILVSRLTVLTKGLDALAGGGMPDGELRRRRDMISRLQDDAEVLGKLAVVTRSNANSSALRKTVEADPKLRQELFSSSNASGSSLPSRTGTPFTRVLGAAPKETAQTRSLDNAGLLQLQVQAMDEQDVMAEDLVSVARRQKGIAEEIAAELERHNELLDQINQDVDRTQGKLSKAGKDIKKLGS
ncbi:Phox-like protein [Atractiella rhizophila]|nr:Phox-like protein [Atractiella rhizophila]